MTATKEQRFKAQEIEDQMKRRQKEIDDEINRMESKAKELRQTADDKKSKSRRRQIKAGDRNLNQIQRAEMLRRSAKLGSEAVDIKHKAKELEREALKKKQDAKFEQKQMQEEATKLKV